MSLIQIKDLSFSYPGSYTPIFDGVQLQIDSTWKLGLIGRNGRGKTTFFRLLLAQYEYQGSITHEVAFRYFPYPVANPEKMTLEVLQEACPHAEDWEFMKELNLLDVEIDRLYLPFATLSDGEQNKVLLAALFLNENTFLLIDEPTNHLDDEARQKIADYLAKKQGFILISHDRRLLDVCVDHILAMNKASIELQQGNFSSWYLNKQQQDQFELAQNEKLKKEVKRLNEAAKRTASWSNQVEKSKNGTTNSGTKLDKGYVGHKAAKMMKKSKTHEKRMQEAIHQKEQLLTDVEEIENLKLQPLFFKQANQVLAQELVLSYADKIINQNPLNFTIQNQERVAIVGKNGSGKSTLLKAILQDSTVNTTGLLKISPQLIISYVPQDAEFLAGSLKKFTEDKAIDYVLFLAILRKLGFAREQFDKDVASFSAGQKKKVLIAASLCQPAHLYIWDEPLNYIDLISRIQIEQLILKFQPTLLFVEHDQAFQQKIATKIIQM
ncbi:ribosomal protection-like ABC-F family protein [Enterococcus columbae]|uniref:ABC transporter domain-containing protein n=1 Tax=Enterococcus columbae DSM 7374 = ATCC 51263 TaxID=1121865 RepID=S1NP41_9ENTE|nr:ABC-F type ribosomal protection protein [Enterococcus columbae]EOT44626.1 hypothetical protein OMW_00682 [Enterococcus columbae DSM 7374 = ATCC 51263]EOW87478.1 hypothetical protein I568_00522 [Enterococcus columbae DSM 7374 = ATCC 51263]OJG25135.1 hypothetical protein RR47_GL001923 [Enterococcus columbae DSM 7374 = ATCC 51263]